MTGRERITSIEPQKKVVPTFSKEEMERRITKLRKLMVEENVEAILFTSHHNINYYSDFLYISFGRPFGLIVTQNSHTTITPKIDGGHPARRSYGDNIIYTDWNRDNFYYAVRKVLDEHKITKGKLGIENDHLTVERYAILNDALSHLNLVDISQTVMKLRMIKSNEEIDLIRTGSRITELGGYAIVEAIEEGASEYELALYGNQVMSREVMKAYPHVELRDTWSLLQSDINTESAHTDMTSRKLQRGDIISLNCFTTIGGYFTSLERTLFLEEVSEAHLKYWQMNCEVLKYGLELIKPGVRCKDIALELNKVYEEYGLLKYRTFGYGHSFGVFGHYYGREGALELREDCETILEPGMVISFEPAIMIPFGNPGAGGYREHETLIVHEDHVENITTFPVGPEENII